jgi:hypothetical protein
MHGLFASPYNIMTFMTTSKTSESVSKPAKKLGSGEIRTRASEETGALNQRLRPLGHATLDA